MSNSSPGNLMKRLVILALLTAAAVWGYKYGFPEMGGASDESDDRLTKLTAKNFSAATEAEDVLVVVNVEKEDSVESKTLEEFLEELEKRDVYSDKVAFAEVVGKHEPELAEEMGAKLKDPRGHLVFYAGNSKLGELVGQTDRKVVEAEIERYLEGLIKRVGPGWLPDVPGMERRTSSRSQDSKKSQTS